MSVAILRSSISNKTARSLMEKSYVVEDLGFMGLKYNKTPLTIKMFTATSTHLIIPFSVGFDLGYVENEFPWECIQPLIETEGNVFDIDEEDEDFRPFHGEFREYQEEVIEELLEDLDKYRSTSIGLPPGWGKTLGGIFCGWRVGLRMIIIMSLTTVLSGWVETCIKFMKGFKVWIVGCGECPDDVDIILCMDKRFEKIPEEILSTIGTVIFDEIHLLCSETRVPIFLKLFPKYVINISATLEKANGFHHIAYKLAGMHGVFKVSKEPYIVYVIETGIDGEEVRNKNNLLISAKLQKSLVNNEFRQDILLNFLMLNCNEHKIICLRMVKDNIPEFVDKVRNCGITCDSLYGSKKSCKNSQITIGTSQKMGTGYDEATSCMDFWKNPIKSDVMVFENLTDNKYIFEQNRGRVMRSKNPAIILLVDNNSNCKGKVKRLRPWIKETNGTIKYVNYWDFVLPKAEQIFKRIFCDEIFYRVLTPKEYKTFLLYHIVDHNEDDYGESALKIFRTEDDTMNFIEFKQYKQCFILELTKLTIEESNDDNDKEYISTSPICKFNVVKIHKI